MTEGEERGEGEGREEGEETFKECSSFPFKAQEDKGNTARSHWPPLERYDERGRKNLTWKWRRGSQLTAGAAIAMTTVSLRWEGPMTAHRHGVCNGCGF